MASFSKFFAAAMGAAVLLCSSPAMAGGPSVGQVDNVVKVYAGSQASAPRSVGLKYFKSAEDDNTFAKLVAFDSKGNIIWKGPEITDFSDRRSLGCFNFGSSEIQIAADLDGDGKVELAIAEPRSDVSPNSFQIWRWDGSKFYYIHSKCLLDTDFTNGIYKWLDENKCGASERWIERFVRPSASHPGCIEVKSMEINCEEIAAGKQPSDPIKDVVLKPAPGGFVVVKK